MGYFNSSSDLIIITGPTTTGKSKIAATLARKFNGALINTDDYYFFAGKNLHLGLGLALDEPPRDIPHFNYGCLKIESAKPKPHVFLDLISEAINQARSDGYLPILEGGSYYLNSVLIKAASTRYIFAPSLRKEDLDVRVKTRIRYMLDEGLLKEVDRLIAQELHKSWLVQGGAIYKPAVDYKLGYIDRGTMVARIAARVTEISLEQDRKYKTLSALHWLDGSSSAENLAEYIANYSLETVHPLQ